MTAINVRYALACLDVERATLDTTGFTPVVNHFRPTTLVVGVKTPPALCRWSFNFNLPPRALSLSLSQHRFKLRYHRRKAGGVQVFCAWGCRLKLKYHRRKAGGVETTSNLYNS